MDQAYAKLFIFTIKLALTQEPVIILYPIERRYVYCLMGV